MGLLVGTDANGSRFVGGSGVLINQRWVLTAGHVILAENDILWDSIQFFPSRDALGNIDNFVEVDLAIPFDGYNEAIGTGFGDDIGLIRLKNPISDITPATRFFGDDAVDVEFLASGYGNPGVFPNEGSFDGIRRSGRNTIDSFGASFGVSSVEEQYFVADFDRFASGSPLPLEWQGTGGDSGGGWFINVNGSYQLAGITHGRLLNNRNTFAIRTSLYNDWIDETIRVNSVPEPSSAGFLILSLIGIAARRKRCQIPTVTN